MHRIASSCHLIFAINRLDHGLEVHHFPLDEADQDLVRILHQRGQVVEAILEVLLFAILEQDELVVLFRKLLLQVDGLL